MYLAWFILGVCLAVAGLLYAPTKLQEEAVAWRSLLFMGLLVIAIGLFALAPAERAESASAAQLASQFESQLDSNWDQLPDWEQNYLCWLSGRDGADVAASHAGYYIADQLPGLTTDQDMWVMTINRRCS